MPLRAPKALSLFVVSSFSEERFCCTCHKIQFLSGGACGRGFHSCLEDVNGTEVAGYLIDLINGFFDLCPDLRYDIRKSKDGLWGEPNHTDRSFNGKTEAETTKRRMGKRADRSQTLVDQDQSVFDLLKATQRVSALYWYLL